MTTVDFTKLSKLFDI